MKLIALAPIALSLFIAGAASADDGSAASGAPEGLRAQRGIVNIPPTIITSPPMRPMAAIAVSQIQPKLTLVELRQPFLSRIEDAIFNDQF